MGSLVLALGYLAKQVAWRWQREGDGTSYGILAAWLVIPVGFLTLNPVKLHPHYLVILYPAGYIALGVLWDGVLSWTEGRGRAGRLLRGLAWLAIGSVAAWQVYLTCYTLDFVAKHDTTGGYGLPLRFAQRAATLACEKAAEEGVGEVWVITEGSDLAWEEMPLVLNYLLEPRVGAVFLGQGGETSLLLPADRPAVYLVTRPDEKGLKAIRALGGERKGEVVFPVGQGSTEVLVVPALTREEVRGLPSVARDDRLDSGLTLVGYDWPDGARPGATVDLITYWEFVEIGANVAEEQHSIFNHLVDRRGKKWAQRDGLGLAERHWKDGYVLMQWFSLSLPSDMPSGEYQLVTGLYRLRDGARSLVLDEEGQPVGDAIELGPLTVSVE
jgi:hypothetical protein